MSRRVLVILGLLPIPLQAVLRLTLPRT
jgi:hypothetical protein